LLTTCLAIASAVYATSTNACVWILEASAFACLVISEAVLRPSLPDTYDEVHALWVGLFFVFLGAIPGQLPDAKETDMRASETSFARPLTSTPPAPAPATSATSTDL